MTAVERKYEHDDKARTDLRSSDALEIAMLELALCCRDLLVSRPLDGPDLGTILIGHRFEAMMEEHGLCIVPLVPKPAMHTAWNRGWIRSFAERYRTMLAAVWSA
jgi:hypothetical protein